jgi:hypothetical protein
MDRDKAEHVFRYYAHLMTKQEPSRTDIFSVPLSQRMVVVTR